MSKIAEDLIKLGRFFSGNNSKAFTKEVEEVIHTKETINLYENNDVIIDNSIPNYIKRREQEREMQRIAIKRQELEREEDDFLMFVNLVHNSRKVGSR